jgi:hypothetical protein
MRRLLCLMAVIFSLWAHARPSLAQSGAATQSAKQCDEMKARLYNRFLSNYQGTVDRMAEAYEAAKEFIRVCPDDSKATQYLKQWVERYERAARDYELNRTIEPLIAATKIKSGDAQKDADAYAQLARAYVSGRYTAQLQEWLTLLRAGKSTRSPEVEAATARATETLDLIIDAYARAVATCGPEAKCQSSKLEWMQNLILYYRFKHDNSDAGLEEYISRVLAQSLPIPKP